MEKIGIRFLKSTTYSLGKRFDPIRLHLPLTFIKIMFFCFNMLCCIFCIFKFHISIISNVLFIFKWRTSKIKHSFEDLSLYGISYKLKICLPTIIKRHFDILSIFQCRSNHFSL